MRQRSVNSAQMRENAPPLVYFCPPAKKPTASLLSFTNLISTCGLFIGKKKNFMAQIKTHFFNLPLRFASALCLLLLAAGHTAFGAVTFTGDTSNDGTTVIVGDIRQGNLTIDGGSGLSNTNGYVGKSANSTGTHERA